MTIAVNMPMVKPIPYRKGRRGYGVDAHHLFKEGGIAPYFLITFEKKSVCVNKLPQRYVNHTFNVNLTLHHTPSKKKSI